MRDLAVYIINYNTTQLSMNAIKSVSDRYKFVDIFMLDNSEITDKDLEKFCSTYSNVNYFVSDVNKGFAGGMNYLINLGIKSGKNFHFFMNSDSELIDDSLYKAYKLLLQNDFGVIGLINENSNGIKWQAGKNINYGGLSFRKAIAGRDSVTECDYVPGSSFLTTTEVFVSVGGLHEEYFAYYEEVEFCLRVKKAGKKVGFVNGSRIFHEPGKSSESRLKIYLKLRNRMYFIKRNYPRFSRIKNILLVTIFIVKRPNVLFRHSGVLFSAIRDFSTNHMFLGRFL